jgi:hypothetical protein
MMVGKEDTLPGPQCTARSGVQRYEPEAGSIERAILLFIVLCQSGEVMQQWTHPTYFVCMSWLKMQVAEVLRAERTGQLTGR